jgi:copper homeostasis protein (lipoprotein)
MYLRLIKCLLFVVVVCLYSCSGSDNSKKGNVYKGVYSFGPEVKSFKDCDTGFG